MPIIVDHTLTTGCPIRVKIRVLDDGGANAEIQYIGTSLLQKPSEAEKAEAWEFVDKLMEEGGFDTSQSPSELYIKLPPHRMN